MWGEDMLIDAIRVGDKINIKSLEGKNTKEYVSKLLDIKGVDVVSVGMPIEKNQIVLLELGRNYMITFYTTKGLFACEAVVASRYKVRSIYIAELQLIGSPKKVQRREFYRFHCMLDLEIFSVQRDLFINATKLIAEDPMKSGSDLQNKINALESLLEIESRLEKKVVHKIQGTMTDISGGGVRFKTEVPMLENTEVCLKFSLDGGETKMKVFGNIISCERSQLRSDLYENRLKYTCINADQREQIVRYVLNEERKQRQKEKGLY